MKKVFKVLAFLIGGLFVFASKTYAICPVCTVAVGAGVGFAQWFGIDDTISGVWIGGLIVSMLMWNLDWFKRKNISFKGIKTVTAVAYYALIIGPMYWQGIIGHPFNKLWGIDKLVIGMVLGSIVFYLSSSWYLKMKEKNGGHAHFPFEKIVIAAGSLILVSIVFYFITK